MKCPVHIQTKQGMLEYESITSKYFFSKENGLYEWFKSYCLAESMKQEIDIIQFLDKSDSKIDDEPELMLKWKEMSDKQALYHYFSRDLL